jgi:histidine triad (HIT) family protein
MTIFEKIIRGEIPCHKIYEDDQVFSFLDIGPISRGHTLVIPKEPAVTFDELSDEAAAALGKALPRICRAVKTATGCTAYNLLQNNGPLAHQAVLHVHFHIIPRYEGDGAGSGLGIIWRSSKLDSGPGAELAKKIAASMP